MNTKADRIRRILNELPLPEGFQDNGDLTLRQKEILDFIASQIRVVGLTPSVRDIGRKFNIKSPNGVMCHLRALVQKGYIKRAKHKARSIQLVTAGDCCPTCGKVK